MFSTTTRLLIRWAHGLISVGEDGAEQFVEMAGVQTYEEALELGRDLLAAHRDDRETTAVSGHVHTGAQQPGDAFYVGDTLDGMEVQSIAISMDGERQTVVTPELGDKKQKRLDALARRVARSSAGSTSEWASPFAERQGAADPLDSPPPRFTYTFPEGTGSV